MPDFSAERSFLLFLLLNATVLGSTAFFSLRCITRNRSQAIVDSTLSAYAIQYLSVCIPGFLGYLHPMSVMLTALLLSLSLILIAVRLPSIKNAQVKKPIDLPLIAVAIFVVAFVFLFVHTQADLPVISNDALTYHFPAAVQWLQRGRIDLFQTWFFNPANTYSPLAGSVFITWLIVPFKSDLLARFVEVPPLLCIGAVTYRWILHGVREPTHQALEEVNSSPKLKLSAALITAAVLLARPIFTPCMMGKDDLFVAFFFMTALTALSKESSSDKFGPIRLGIAIGLLLATKYTALLCAPILLLAMDGPRWSVRKWATAILVTSLFAGPWYLRNYITVGNPLFPLKLPLFLHGLFTTSRSLSLLTLTGLWNTTTGGAYGLPIPLATILFLSWLIALALSWRQFWLNTMLRVIVLGPPMGFAIFFFTSPFPEVRFLLPTFIVLFAGFSSVLVTLRLKNQFSLLFAGLLLPTSLFTLFGVQFSLQTGEFAALSLAIAGAGVLLYAWLRNSTVRRMIASGSLLFAMTVYGYTNWSAYAREHTDPSAYSTLYPELNPLWQYVNQNLPADTTLAYTNLYLVYPFAGTELKRNLIYIPTRADVKSIADIGWLGDHLAGEQLVPAAVKATFAQPDRSVWLQNLQQSHARYLVIGFGGSVALPPEAGYVADDSSFLLLCKCKTGEVYQIQSAAVR